MSESPHRLRRGVPIPAIGTCVAIAAAVCAAFAIWSRFGTSPPPDPVVPPEPSQAMIRIQTVEELILGGREGIPELVAMLGDPDPRIRRDALFGLGQLGPQADDQIETVRARLSDESAGVRSGAVSALRRISRDPEILVSAIGPLLADADEGVRRDAITALVTVSRDEAQKLRDDGSWDGREAPELQTTAFLLGLLKSDIPAVRRGAMRVLKQLYVPASKLEATVRELLDDADAEVRDRALSLLVTHDMTTIAELRAALRREFPLEQAAYPPAGQAGPLLDEHLQPVYPALPAIALRAAAAAELVPDLALVLDRLQVLEHKHQPDQSSGRARDFDLDWRASELLKALSAMKQAARPAAPHLLRRIDELHDYNRIKFAQTLTVISAEPAEISAILVPIISDDKPIDPTDDYVARARHLNIWEAGKLLVQIDPQEARRQVSVAIPRLGGGKKPVNKMALFAIYGLAPEAREAQSRIEPLRKDPDSQVSDIATYILNQLRR